MIVALLITFFVFNATINAQVDFSNYPFVAQPCLNLAYSQSGCPTFGTATYINSCLCANEGNFLTRTATCIASNDPTDMSTVYTTLEYNCRMSGTPIIWTQQQFFNAAGNNGQGTATVPTTRTATPTTTAIKESPTTTFSTSITPSITSSFATSSGTAAAASAIPSPSETPHKGKFSQSDIIALGVGIPSVIFAAVACLSCWCYHR